MHGAKLSSGVINIKKKTEPFILEKCFKSSALKASLPGYLLLHQEFINFMIPKCFCSQRLNCSLDIFFLLKTLLRN